MEGLEHIEQDWTGRGGNRDEESEENDDEEDNKVCYRIQVVNYMLASVPVQ